MYKTKLATPNSIAAASKLKESPTKSRSSGTCRGGWPISAEQTRQFLIKELPAALKLVLMGMSGLLYHNKIILNGKL
jgi:hypothetical protein